MKKEDVSGIIVYLLIMALAVLFGINVLQTYADKSQLGAMYFLFILGAIVVGVVFNAVLFELAHRLGAKVGRYQVVSTAILGVTFFKEEGKLKVKFAGYDGLTGETKIVPKKDVKKEPNPSPYLWFGTLFFIIEITIVTVLFSFLTSKNMPVAASNIGYFILIVGAIGGMILLYNILPLHLDATTDGYRLTMITSAANKKAFNELLRVEYELSQGNTNVEIKTFTDITNFTADLNLNKVYLLLDRREFKEAEELLDIILAGKETISQKVYVRARAQKIYINIYTKPIEEAREFYNKEVSMAERRELSRDLNMTSIRTYLLISGLLDKSRSETMIAINNVSKAFPRTPKKRQNTEIALFNEAIDMVSRAHPDWEIGNYKLKPIEEKKTSKNK